MKCSLIEKTPRVVRPSQNSAKVTVGCTNIMTMATKKAAMSPHMTVSWYRSFILDNDWYVIAVTGSFYSCSPV